jgi:hypothetical protein
VSGPALTEDLVVATDEAGNYRVTLPAGAYTLSFVAVGYFPQARERLWLGVGRTVRANVQLRPFEDPGGALQEVAPNIDFGRTGPNPGDDLVHRVRVQLPELSPPAVRPFRALVPLAPRAEPEIEVGMPELMRPYESTVVVHHVDAENGYLVEGLDTTSPGSHESYEAWWLRLSRLREQHALRHRVWQQALAGPSERSDGYVVVSDVGSWHVLPQDPW